ncbi:hypothetical protein Hypma_013065 [Hypsizygus marmoreus]|uniref:Uncharacterized protein n=1 Tax=Hypsizygus marmoreus TaxID=39966 RepID=A0A369JI01_HYPMA|nr:hypothetical protein Hypma_013065 [Hypsizygus marmoreus]
MENEATRHPVLEDDRRDLTVFVPLKSEDDQNSQGLRAKIDFSDIKGECKSMNGVDKRKIDDVEWTMAVNLEELLLLNDEKPPTTGIQYSQEDRVRRLQTTVYVDNKELGIRKTVHVKLDSNGRK